MPSENFHLHPPYQNTSINSSSLEYYFLRACKLHLKYLLLFQFIITTQANFITMLPRRFPTSSTCPKSGKSVCCACSYPVKVVAWAIWVICGPTPGQDLKELHNAVEHMTADECWYLINFIHSGTLPTQRSPLSLL